MTVWSLTPFYDELDILEIRLAELDPVVDVFVLAEATLTHSNQTKLLHFERNRDRFKRWLPMIRNVIVNFPALAGNWHRENYQRNQLAHGCADMADGDLVILSDLDEIPAATLVRAVQAGEYPLPLAVGLPIHTYRLDWRWPTVEASFSHLRFLHGRDLKAATPQKMIDRKMPQIVGDYGWHFSYVGDAGRIVGKIRALADDWVKENPLWQDPDHVQQSIDTGRDVFGRTHRDAELVGDDRLPHYVVRNKAKFRHLLT